MTDATNDSPIRRRLGSAPAGTAVAEVLRPHHRKTRGRFLGLQNKIILSFMLLLVVTVCGVSYAFATLNQHVLRQAHHDHSQQVARAAALAVAPLLESDHENRLAAVARHLTNKTDVLALHVVDASGRVRAHAGRQELSLAPPDNQVIEPIQLMRPEEIRDAQLGYWIRVSAPVIGGEVENPRMLGTISLALKTGREQALGHNVGILIVGGACTIIALCSIMTIAMVEKALSPLKALANAARKAAAGSYEPVINDRVDEIGKLADSFNEMADQVCRQRKALADANQQLLDANRTLEQKVRQRTAEIEAARNRLRGEIAEKEDFLRAVSHDLNAPLRNIDGMVTMLLRKHGRDLEPIGAGEVTHRLDRIKKNVAVETDLINELLELSRIKTRRQEMQIVSVEKLLWELRGLFDEDLRSRAIELRIETQLPELRCEHARLRQVFQNLIDNAIKYMGDGPDRTISIGAHVGTSETSFYVRDTGIGIDPEDIDKVFNVFRRGRKGSERAAGKGIGLASVKSILQNYNGTIWVESEPGHGSTFRFTINNEFLASTATSSGAAGKATPPAAAPEHGNSAAA